MGNFRPRKFFREDYEEVHKNGVFSLFLFFFFVVVVFFFLMGMVNAPLEVTQIINGPTIFS